MRPPYIPTPNNPAEAIVSALQREQSNLEPKIPEGHRIVAVLTLTNGHEIDVISAYAVSPDLLVFMGIRDKQTITAIIRYEMVAHVVFHFEKGEPRDINFTTQSRSVGFSS